MILIGQHERVVVVGPTEPQHCLRCQTETGFAPQLRYKMARIDLLFASPTIAATRPALVGVDLGRHRFHRRHDPVEPSHARLL
ncbi:hypothetical protein [Stenotrophomonas maltophilia]|uniref:hypothetical protein n=1 Tax=Stenotrophomonas maltophilia TaxID=40324 RepID=UPI0013134B80|nr:hypothetical protein PGKDCPLP_00870 [Stenotrophomonas maltophilia]